MADCIFCKIVEGRISSKKVYEDKGVLAFEDIAPKAPTHVLIIPKKHIPGLSDLGAEDASLVGEIAARAAAIARQRGLNDFRLVANNGEGAGQSVFHLHFHLLAGRPMSWPPG